MIELDVRWRLPPSPRQHWWIQAPEDNDDAPPLHDIRREGLWVIEEDVDNADNTKVWDAPLAGILQ